MFPHAIPHLIIFFFAHILCSLIHFDFSFRSLRAAFFSRSFRLLSNTHFSVLLSRCIRQNYVCRKKIIVKRNRNVRFEHEQYIKQEPVNCWIIKTQAMKIQQQQQQKKYLHECMRQKKRGIKDFSHIFHVSSYLSRHWMEP